MARVSDYDDRREQLRPEHVEGAPNQLVVTCMSAELWRQNTLASVEFYEYPGYIVWARGAELRSLSHMLGAETDDWPHRQVVLEKVTRNNPRNGQKVVKYVVAPSAEWASMVEAKVAPDPVPRRALRPRTGKGGDQDGLGTG